MKIKTVQTVEVELDVETLARLFAHLDDDSQAQFFVKVAEIAERDYPSGDYILDKPSGIAPPWGQIADSCGLTNLDLCFRQIPVAFQSELGTPFTRWIDVGMPAINQAFLDCVIYLYPSIEAARTGKNFGGTGFIVVVHSQTRPDWIYPYVVTNYHVAIKPKDGAPSPIIRLMTMDGRPDPIQFGPEDWHFVPGLGDVAAIPLPFPVNHKWNWIPVGSLLSKAEADDPNSIGCVGDEAFMVGRFVDHDGGQTNQPAVRFGNISVAPRYISGELANSNKDAAYYCLDMHSRTGFSGSPVFVYRTAGSDLRTMDAVIHPPIVKTLGIHCAQFEEAMKMQGTKGTVLGYSGMNCVLPAWSIASLLNCEKFSNQRRMCDQQWANGNYPRAEKPA